MYFLYCRGILCLVPTKSRPVAKSPANLCFASPAACSLAFISISSALFFNMFTISSTVIVLGSNCSFSLLSNSISIRGCPLLPLQWNMYCIVSQASPPWYPLWVEHTPQDSSHVHKLSFYLTIWIRFPLTYDSSQEFSCTCVFWSTSNQDARKLL